MADDCDEQVSDSAKKPVEEQQSKFIVAKLSALAVAMFVFAFWVMPPLYTLLCEVTGLRKVGGAYTPVANVVDESRLITVQFIASQNEAMPWVFKPEVFEMKVHPGQVANIAYLAENPTANTMVAQAVPSITPYNAVNFFHKTECFCFERQPLAAGESAELGMQFIVDRDLPKKVKTITVAYTLFDITDRTGNEDQEQAAQEQTEKPGLAVR